MSEIVKQEISNWIDRNSAIKINNKQFSIIVDTLENNGYTVLVEDDSFLLDFSDQFGTHHQKISFDDVLGLTSSLLYGKGETIKHELDDIKVDNLDKIGIYCNKLSELINNENGICMINKAFMQTSRFKELSKAINGDMIIKNKGIAR